MPPMSERITREAVAHVATLARLALTEDELEMFTGQLADILEHAEDVGALDLGDLEPMTHPVPLKNVLRPDVPTATVDTAEVLAAAPATQDDRFLVPAILGDAP